MKIFFYIRMVTPSLNIDPATAQLMHSHLGYKVNARCDRRLGPKWRDPISQ